MEEIAFYAEKYHNMHENAIYFPTAAYFSKCTIYSTSYFPQRFTQGVEKSYFNENLIVKILCDIGVKTFEKCKNDMSQFFLCGILISFMTVETEMMPSAIASAIIRVVLPCTRNISHSLLTAYRMV